MRDSEFIRGNVPMTKEEVRTVVMSKLELTRDSIVWDIGAGTGSISVEAAIVADKGAVYAFEKNEDAISLIQKNADKHGIKNIAVLAGNAVDTINEYKRIDPTHIIIGGGGAELPQILELILEKGFQQCRILVSAVTLETTVFAMKFFEESFCDVEGISISISKMSKLGENHLFQPNNQVYIISGVTAKGGAL